jgi:hypothetical protein
MSRRRLAVAALGVAAAATLLTGCDKPTPNITVFSGHTAIRVAPAKYCYDGNANTCRTNNVAGTITANGGSTIVVDVPKDIADGHWAVTAFTLDSAGTVTTIDTASSAVVSKTHAVRVSVPLANSGGYHLAVQSFSGQSATGEWDIEVDFTNTA